MTAKKKPAAPVAATATGKTDADFNKLAKRLLKLEKEMRALRRAVNPPAPKARVARITKLDMLKEEAKHHAGIELEYTYLIATNVVADVHRLLGDSLYSGVGAPRAGKDGEYEEVRLSTASSLLNTLTAEMGTHWVNYKSTPGQPWAKMPPQDGRRFVIAHLREQVENNLPMRIEAVVDGMVDDVFESNRPSVTFDRVNAAPTAADEGAQLARKVITNIFKQLETDVPGDGTAHALAESNRGVEIGCKSLLASVAKFRPAKPLGFATHEELFADCYTLIAVQAIETMCNLAHLGAGQLGQDSVPSQRRFAGAILADMGISQRGNPDNLTEKELNEDGVDNGVPAEFVAAVQLREFIRVIDVMQDSLYDGELNVGVRQLYTQRAAEIFPNEPAREMTPKFEASGWNATRKILEKSNHALFKLVQAEDGFTNPRVSPPDRTLWTFASAGLQ